MRKLRFTNKAVEDLSSIWRYTFQEWSEKQADEYYQMLISACNPILPFNIRPATTHFVLSGIENGKFLFNFVFLNEHRQWITRKS